MAGQDLRRRTGNDRRRERGARHPHVAGGDDAVRHCRRNRRAHRHRRDHVAAGGGHVRLGEAVHGVAVGRPRGHRVVEWVRCLHLVKGPDGDHERVVAGGVRHVHRAGARPVVPGGRHDDDTAEPEPFDRLVERIEAEARRGGAGHREVGDADVVGVLVGQDPVGRRDHVADD